MNLTQLRRIALILVVVTGLVAACGDDNTTSTTSAATTTTAGTGTTVAVGATISVSNFQYEPAAVTITAGQSVSFEFQGGTHTATADDGSWSSGEQSAGGHFVKTFDQPGVYAFHCEIHGSMHGTITVTG